jgi:predicted ATP-dependent endonuclease of OLD family
MLLKEVHVTNFRNILDSTIVPIENDITSLVGKNESGKTAFLTATYLLNPAYESGKFNIQKHYPAWLEKKHRKDGIDIEKREPIRAKFELEEKDIKEIDAKFGSGVIIDKEITVSKNYVGQQLYAIQSNEAAAVKNFLSQFSIKKSLLKDIKQFEELDKLLESLKQREELTVEEVTDILDKRGLFLENQTYDMAIINFVSSLLPTFFYFDQYNSLPGSFKIREILEKNLDDLDQNERTARALLELAGADNDYLLDPNYETRKRELENVANSITTEVLEYWSTNQELRVHIDITQRNINAPNGRQSVVDELVVRLWDNRHLLSLPFDQRSSGFRWFFSFLTAFSEFESKDTKTIILLDEPGLGLHARAQKDFLRFIEERLSRKCQVIYSTHSPFMIQPNMLHRVRLIQDNGREEGSKATTDVFNIDKDTLFPLQGALGYDLAQHLFVSNDNLVVEGTSDYTYIYLLSDLLNAKGREGLDRKWSIIPVGGADLVPTFVALLGNHLDVTVLVDSRKEGNQRLVRLANQNILDHSRIVTIGEIIGKKLGDIEDLFETNEYLELFNAAFQSAITESQLVGNGPIVNRLADATGLGRFDHGKPADIILRTRDKFLDTLSSSTLDKFEKLFKRINATLK